MKTKIEERKEAFCLVTENHNFNRSTKDYIQRLESQFELRYEYLEGDECLSKIGRDRNYTGVIVVAEDGFTDTWLDAKLRKCRVLSLKFCFDSPSIGLLLNSGTPSRHFRELEVMQDITELESFVETAISKRQLTRSND